MASMMTEAADSKPREARRAPAAIGSLESESGDPFENIETGVLEQDLATHQAALLEETEDGEILDLGRVEGLSGAPSTLRAAADSTKRRNPSHLIPWKKSTDPATNCGAVRS